jgi:glycosyltransferase involved in cell wall biosynthesis
VAADVIVLTNDMSVRGGTQGVVAQVALGLSQRRGVRLVTLEGATLAYPELRTLPFNSLAPRSPGRRGRTMRLPVQALRFASLVARERPRGVVSFLARANLVNVLAGDLTRHRFRSVISERNFNTMQYANGIEQRTLLRAMRLLYPRADHVVANSGPLADDLHTAFDIPRQRLVVIPNPLDVDRLQTLSEEQFEALPLSDLPSKWLLYAGRLNEQKNPILLLRAFKRIRNDVCCSLVIAGDGPLRGEVDLAIAALDLGEDVIPLGWVDNPYPLMSRATALVLSSDYEGSPNALLEAMALGCPIIATDSPGGSREALRDGEAGILVPPRDENALAAAIKEVMQDDSLRERLIERGRSAALAHSPDRVIGSFLRLLER